MTFWSDLVGAAKSQPEPCTDTARNIVLVQEGSYVSMAESSTSLMFSFLSQDKVLQRFVEQFIDDDKVGVDRVQQRFVEQDLDAPRVGSLTWSGGAVLRRDHLARAVSPGNELLVLGDTCSRVQATVFGGFRKIFLRFST